MQTHNSNNWSFLKNTKSKETNYQIMGVGHTEFNFTAEVTGTQRIW